MASTITTAINDRYGATARAATTTAHTSNTSSSDNNTATAAAATNIATAFGYSASDLVSLPPGSNLGLSCGNPLALAHVRAGETVVDLGSGGGLDVFLAARQVGPTGWAIGVDQNPDMLALAERNRVRGGFENVRFVKSSISRIPTAAAAGGASGVEDGSVDCVVSNCVINLVPHEEKGMVFKGMGRMLKKGGRVAVSDLLAKKTLPQEIREDVAAYVGCIAGAALVEEYDTWLREAGFEDVMIVDAGQDCNQYKRCGEGGSGGRDGCCGPEPATVVVEKKKPAGRCCGGKKTGEREEEKREKKERKEEEHRQMSKTTEEADLNDWIGSFKIYAVKR